MERRGRALPSIRTKVKIIISSVLVLLLFFTGCIDLELMDHFLPRDEDITAEYEMTLKKDLEYYFDTSLIAPPSQLTKEYNNQEFRILEKTLFVKIEISVQLDKNDLVQEILKAAGINETLTRHVTIRFTDPKNLVIAHWEFYDTESLTPLYVYSPEPGIWTVNIDAKGIGVEYEGFELKDGFDIKVYAFEPVN